MTHKEFNFFAPYHGQTPDSTLAMLAVQNCKQYGVGLAVAARTATTATAAIPAQSFKGIHVELDISAVPGAGGIYVQIRTSRDAGGVTYQTIYTSSTFTTVSIPAFVIYPGIANLGSLVGANYVMFGRYNLIQVVHTTADSYTYGLKYHLLP